MAEENREEQKPSKKEKKDIKITDEDIALFNVRHENSFKNVEFRDRIVFLPHCLRKIKVCKAENTEEGWRCKHCTKECTINIVTREAEKLGYKYFIAPGGSLVFNLMNKYRPKAVLGVACHKELKLAVDMMNSSYEEIAYYTIPLTKDGCVNTEVNIDKVKEALLLAQQTPISEEIVKEQKEYYEKEKAVRKWNFVYLKKYWKYFAVITIATGVALSILFANLFVSTNIWNTNTSNRNGDVIKELSFFSEPSISFSSSIANLTLNIYNDGDMKEKNSIKIRAQSFYANNKIDEKTIVYENAFMPKSIWTLNISLKIKSENTTSFQISLLYDDIEIKNLLIFSKKGLYITEVKSEIFYKDFDKKANVSVSIFNEKNLKQPNTIQLEISYYTSWNEYRSTAYIKNEDELELNSTWNTNTIFDIYDLDTGNPKFVVQLYSYGKLIGEYSI